MDADDLDELDWVVWNLEVRDPGAQTEPGVAERTTAVITDMAGSLGCVFIQCCDDDAVDEVPYYSWLVRVPSEQHLHRTEHGVPVVVAALHEHLRTLIPKDVDEWQIRPDPILSSREEAGRLLRDAYADLLDPLEVALLGHRHDGAQDMDPEARYWWSDDTVLAGTYTVWLCKDRDEVTPPFRPWLLAYAGLVVEDAFWDGQQGQGLRGIGITPDTPLLVLPRPHTCRWLVTVTTGTFTSRRHVPSQAVGASYRWTGHDGPALARRVAADLTALFPAMNTEEHR